MDDNDALTINIEDTGAGSTVITITVTDELIVGLIKEQHAADPKSAAVFAAFLALRAQLAV